MMNRYMKAVSVCALVFMPAVNCLADQVINDDLIIIGSGCIGAGCSDGEAFGETTLKLKGDVVQLEFLDTSVGTFPSGDWKIVVNDPDGSGSDNYFAVEDINNGNQVFRIDAGTPSESMRIDSTGNIQLSPLGTSRLINVADPVNPTDGVTLGYVNGLTLSPANIPWASSTGNVSVSVSGTENTVLGSGASAGSRDTVVGYRAAVTADSSTAIGSNTIIQSAESVAIGANAVVDVNAAGGTAIGQGARVRSGAANSVALGNSSVADEPNTVSVGASDNRRRVTNVADGVKATDAVNRRQLNGVSRRVSRNSAAIADNRAAIAVNSQAILQNRDAITQLADEMDDTFAGIAALASIIPMTPSAAGRTTFNIGTANYEGETALGISIAHRLHSILFHDAMFLNCGISFAGDEVLAALGAGWAF